MYKVQRQYSN